MKKLVLFFLLIVELCFSIPITYSYADFENDVGDLYVIYNDSGEIISKTNFAEIGDIIITKDFKQYEVYKVNHENFKAYAEYNGKYTKPKITTDEGKHLNFAVRKSVGIYMSHNDESYVPSDNTSSVYGKGGIHDVARALVQEFQKMNYDVNFDETLHIPHDSGAYNRSKITAQRLLTNDLNALFDIHRDGVARSVYVKNIDGKERCKVRIVVGQANSNKEANLQFAMYLVSVAEKICPWLFLDIYYAKGHYNQALSQRALLFEMGTYLAEKELVLETVPHLAEVVDKTLFATVAEEDNTLVVSQNGDAENTEQTINNLLTTNFKESAVDNNSSTNVVIFATVFIGGATILAVYLLEKRKKQTKKT